MQIKILGPGCGNCHALVIDEQVVLAGRVPGRDQLCQLLTAAVS